MFFGRCVYPLFEIRHEFHGNQIFQATWTAGWNSWWCLCDVSNDWLQWFPYPNWPFISRVWRLVETSFMIHDVKMNELLESSQIWKDFCLHTKHFGNTPCAAGISHTFPAAAIVRNGHPRLAGWHWGMAVLDMGIGWNFSLNCWWFRSPAFISWGW